MSLSEPRTSVVYGEFLHIYYCGAGAGGGRGGTYTYVHRVLRFPTSPSHATSLDTRIQDSYVSFPCSVLQASSMHYVQYSVYKDGNAGYVIKESARGKHRADA